MNRNHTHAVIGTHVITWMQAGASDAQQPSPCTRWHADPSHALKQTLLAAQWSAGVSLHKLQHAVRSVWPLQTQELSFRQYEGRSLWRFSLGKPSIACNNCLYRARLQGCQNLCSCTILHRKLGHHSGMLPCWERGSPDAALSAL